MFIAIIETTTTKKINNLKDEVVNSKQIVRLKSVESSGAKKEIEDMVAGKWNGLVNFGGGYDGKFFEKGLTVNVVTLFDVREEIPVNLKFMNQLRESHFLENEERREYIRLSQKYRALEEEDRDKLEHRRLKEKFGE